MANGINFTGAYSTQRDLENVAKYAAGLAINSQEEGPFSDGGLFMVGMPVVGGLYGGGKWLWKNRNDVNGAWDTFKKDAQGKADGFKNAGTYGEKYEYATRVKKAERLLKDAEKNIENIDKKLAKIEAGIKADPSKLTDAVKKEQEILKNSRKTYTTLKEAALKVKVTPLGETGKGLLESAEKLAERSKTGFFGKIGNSIKNKTGITRLIEKYPRIGKLTKFGKGAGAFLAIDGLLTLFTQVIPTFSELGFGKGLEQTGKSAVKVAARVGGWIAGEAGGTAVGATVGAAIGSVFPVVGTAIGGVIGGIIGFAGGCLGQWMAGKAADAIVGKDELEIAQEEQTKQAALNAKNNNQSEDALIQAAVQRLNAEGEDTPDGKIAAASLKKLLEAKAQRKPEENNQANNLAALGINPFGNGLDNQSNTNYSASSLSQDYLNRDFMAASAGLA